MSTFFNLCHVKIKLKTIVDDFNVLVLHGTDNMIP